MSDDTSMLSPAQRLAVADGVLQFVRRASRKSAVGGVGPVDEIGALPAEARFALFPLYRADGVVMTRDLLELMLLYLDAETPDVAKHRELAAAVRGLLA